MLMMLAMVETWSAAGMTRCASAAVDAMCGVGGDGDRTCRHDGDVGDRPFRPVLGDQPDAGAAPDAEGAQAARHRPHLPLGVAPADRPVGAVALRPQEGPIAAPRRPLEEHGSEVRAGVVIHALPPRDPALGAEALWPAFYGVWRPRGIAAALGVVFRHAYMQGRLTRSKRWRRAPRKRYPPLRRPRPLCSARCRNGI